MKSISYKIAFGYFVIIFINVTVAIFAIYYLNRLSSPIEQSVEEKIKNVNAAESMVQSLVQLELVQYALIIDGFDSGLQVEFHTYQNEFYNWHQRAIEGVSETMDIRTLDSILITFNRYLGYWDVNPATIIPLSPSESAPLYVEMMGGSQPIIKKGIEKLH